MRVVNETSYRTDHLRAIAARVAKVEIEDAGARKRLVVVFSYRKRRGWLAAAHDTGVSGHASMGSNRFPGRATILVTRSGIDHTDLAFVLAHELAHTRGMGHALMRGSSIYRREGEWRARYEWAEAMPIDLKPVKGKKVVTPEVALAMRIALARRREKEWTTRARRAATALKKYKRTITRLERKAAIST
jgi:hypothetical protein